MRNTKNIRALGVIVPLICLMIYLLKIGCETGVNNKIYNSDKAIISLPNGELIEGEVETWGDYDGEQLYIKIDGVTYLVNSKNVVLISEK